jgi:ABC-type branched-subunit amino acid transport system substrate-binding protein
MTLHTLRRPIALGAVLVASLALAACGTGSSSSNNSSSNNTSGGVKSGPGVDVGAKTIRIGNISALTGPLGILGKPAVAGDKAYFKALNAAGGIDGWKVKITVKDSGYVPQTHVQLYNQIKNDIALLQSLGSPTTKAIRSSVDQEGLVTMPLSWDSVWGTDKTLAPLGTPYAVDIANLVDYAVNKKGGKGAKFGIIYQNDEYGMDGLRGYEAALKGEGLNDAARATYKVTDTDFTAQVQKMKKAGAKFVVLAAVPSASGPIVGTAASLGYAPTWLMMGPAYVEQLITKDGSEHGTPTPIAGALGKSTLAATFVAPWGDKQAPGMAKMLSDAKKYAPGQQQSIYFTYGYAQGELAAAILKKAIENGDLSRQGILNARLNLGTVKLGGLAPDVTYTPQLGPPSRKSIIAAVDPTATDFLKLVASGYESAVGRSFDIKKAAS